MRRPTQCSFRWNDKRRREKLIHSVCWMYEMLRSRLEPKNIYILKNANEFCWKYGNTSISLDERQLNHREKFEVHQRYFNSVIRFANKHVFLFVSRSTLKASSDNIQPLLKLNFVYSLPLNLWRYYILHPRIRSHISQPETCLGSCVAGWLYVAILTLITQVLMLTDTSTGLRLT